MHILIDHQIFSSQQVGGVSRYFVELVKGLAKDPEILAQVYAPLHCNDYINEIPGFSGIKINAIPKIYRVIQPVDHLLSTVNFRRVMPDLIHETYYQYRSAAPKGCPVVVTAYDLIHERYYQNFRIKDETTLRKRAALRRAAHVIAISESTRQDYIEYFNVPPERITTVLLGNSFPITNSLHPTNDSVRARPYILFVGGRRGYKNFTRVVEAYFASPILARELDLLCFGGGKFLSQELDLIAKHGKSLAKQVHQVSGSDAQLYEAYRNARMLVYPSLYEGFGLPPLEAMAASCPVACTNTSSVPEVVADAALMFDPEQVEDIRLCLERLAVDGDLANRLRQRGIARAHQLTWQRCADATAEVYRKVLDQTKS